MRAFVFAAGTLLALLACKKLTGDDEAKPRATSDDRATTDEPEKPSGAELAIDVRAHAFKAYDGEGITYRGRAPSSTDCTPTLKGARIEKGDKKKGWVAVEVPKATEKLELRYEHQTPARKNQRSRNQIVKFSLLGAGSTG